MVVASQFAVTPLIKERPVINSATMDVEKRMVGKEGLSVDVSVE